MSRPPLPPPDPRAIEPVLRYLDRALPPDEVAALAEDLRGDAAGRLRAATLLLALGQLGELGHEARAGQPQPAAIPLPVPPPRRRRAPWIAAGLGLAAALALAVGLRRGGDQTPERLAREGGAARTPAGPAPERALPPPAFHETALAGRVEAVAGVARAFADGRRDPMDVGTRIGSGSGVETVGAGDRATLLLDDGSRLELGGATRLATLEAGGGVPATRGRAVLEHGELGAEVAPYPGAAPYLMVAGGLELRAREARFRVGFIGGSVRLEVRRGRVDVTRTGDGQTLVVAESQRALLDASGPLVAITVPRPVALLVHGPDDARGGPLDRSLNRRLEALGFTVAPLRDSDLSREALVGKGLVVISSTSLTSVVRERVPAAELRTAEVPVVCCEPGALQPLGMTRAYGTAPVKLRLTMQPGHALAAGLSGDVQVADDAVEITWGRPGPAAIVASTLDDKRPVTFGYERGAAMVTGTAPARRASCFLDPDRIDLVNENGWQLFDAAVRWAAGR